jgi:hypothetical protein
MSVDNLSPRATNILNPTINVTRPNEKSPPVTYGKNLTNNVDKFDYADLRFTAILCLTSKLAEIQPF